MIADPVEFSCDIRDQEATGELAVRVRAGTLTLVRGVSEAAFDALDWSLVLGPTMTPIALPPDKDTAVISTQISESGRITSATSWHHDQSFAPRVPEWSVLYCRRTPLPSVPTVFCDASELFGALSPGMQRFLKATTSIHAAYYPDHGVPLESALAVAEHPSVMAVEGDTEALFLAPATFVGFGGWSQGESSWIADRLFAMMNWPELGGRHKWREGDLLIWPNRRYVHRALPLVSAGERRLDRLVGYWAD